MRLVVVDASVVVAGLFKDGAVRDLLLNTETLEVCAPVYVKGEVARQVPRISARAHLPQATVEALLADFLEAIDLVPLAAYAIRMPEARELARAAGAEGDADFIALSLALACPIWTLDHDFARVPHLQMHSTREIDQLQSGGSDGD